MNSFFDFDDYVNPVQTFLDERFKYNVVSQFDRTITLHLQNDQAELKDSYFQYSHEGENLDLVRVNRVDKEFKNNGDTDSVISVRFVKDYHYDYYERQVFSILELFGNLGGIFEIFRILGGLLVGSIAQKIFNYSIICSLYQVDTDMSNYLKGPNSEDIKKETENDVSRNWSINFAAIKEENKVVNLRTPDAEVKRTCMNNETIQNLGTTRDTLKKQAKVSLIHRRMYNYSISDYFYNLLC